MAIGDGDTQAFASGMTLRDWFAGNAPPPPADWMDTMRRSDQARNPHNEPHKPKIRSTVELIADWNFEYADAMIEARK
jgi:hypothetical protein